MDHDVFLRRDAPEVNLGRLQPLAPRLHSPTRPNATDENLSLRRPCGIMTAVEAVEPPEGSAARAGLRVLKLRMSPRQPDSRPVSVLTRPPYCSMGAGSTRPVTSVMSLCTTMPNSFR
ncbi:hypothetical protein EYF80_028361 [Liparis tanakae]|uniref:Uncharacterized protein n=1 Tax=Liparis tanakae TaxID=230148 RepID=A0A4Z2H905_9TELE|nr:hypothetical protein EYF80_028361 [Liparis tanakae]